MSNKTVTVGNKKIGRGETPYIIAEMACAHDGDLDKALKLVDSAVDGGADAVQLQFFQTGYTVTPHHPVFEILKKIEFSADQWTKIAQYARSKNIHVFVCTYDVPSVELAVKLKADGIKLNSADLSNPEVVMAVAKSKIPFTLGTGASTMEEIANGLRTAEANGAENIVLMHGVQNFPTRTEDLNISRVQLLQDVFEIPVGYHDHTDGDDAFALNVDLIAIGVGACVIEKHITIDRSEKGIDYQAALQPEEFKHFVEQIKRAWTAYGSKQIRSFSESDLRYRKFQKKSIVAAVDIEEGVVLDRTKVEFIRNENPGLPPSEFESQVHGKKASKGIKKYDNILPNDLE